MKWRGKKVYKNGKFTTEIIKKLTAQHGRDQWKTVLSADKMYERGFKGGHLNTIVNALQDGKRNRNTEHNI